MAGNEVIPTLKGINRFTVRDDMVLCGIDNESLFQGLTPAQSFISDIFSGSFTMCFDKTMDEANHDIKQYTSLTQLQGQIRIAPDIRQNAQAFM